MTGAGCFGLVSGDGFKPLARRYCGGGAVGRRGFGARGARLVLGGVDRISPSSSSSSLESGLLAPVVASFRLVVDSLRTVVDSLGWVGDSFGIEADPSRTVDALSPLVIDSFSPVVDSFRPALGLLGAFPVCPRAGTGSRGTVMCCVKAHKLGITSTVGISGACRRARPSAGGQLADRTFRLVGLSRGILPGSRPRLGMIGSWMLELE